MLKMLRADFYKIVRSKILLILLVISLCVTIISPLTIIGDYINGNDFSVYGNLYTQSLMTGIIWIFIIPFVCKDFSSNYIRNVLPTYTQKDKVYYIISKIFYIFVYCLVYTVLSFLIEVIFNYTCGPGMMFNPERDYFTVKQFWMCYIAKFMNAVSVGALILFLCMALKKEYFTLIIFVPYLFFISGLIYNAIDSAVLENTGNAFYIEVYTLFGPIGALSNFATKEIWTVMGLSLLYTAVFSVLGWLVFRKRSY